MAVHEAAAPLDRCNTVVPLRLINASAASTVTPCPNVVLKNTRFNDEEFERA
jgi:hypothetical protein